MCCYRRGWWPSWSTGPRADYPAPASVLHEEEEEVDADETTWDVGRLCVEPLAGPQEYGPYVCYVRADGRRVSFARGGTVVAVQLTADEATWLEDKAMHTRQGFMDPEQSAAFAEFLARQQSVGEECLRDGLTAISLLTG